MTSATHPYHHGDLPNALRKAAAEVIEERGLGDFSLREVARRAGVSHTAPAHHFGDVRGLLTSLAEEGMRQLHDVTAAAAASTDDPVERLSAISAALIDGGRPASTPVAVIANGSTPRERIEIGTLETIAQQCVSAGIAPPAVVVVGEVVGLRARLQG